MSGITDPSEEYFKDGLWAWVTNQWKKLVADASSFLQINIAAQDIDVEVKQTAAADLTPGVMGWDGAAWHKLSMVWGFSEGYCEAKNGQASGAGNATATGSVVPAGQEVWVIEGLYAKHNAGVAKSLIGRVKNNGCFFDLFNESVASGARRYWYGRLTLPPGSYASAIAVSPGDGKSVELYIWGYKMKVAE